MEEENHDFGLITRRRRSRLSRSSCNWGRSFTPRPSLALVKFWQGRVELLLRVLCLVFSSGSLAASVFCYLSLGFPITGEELVDSAASEASKVVMWVICTAVTAIVLQLVVVAGRFLNLLCASSHASLVHVLDVIASVMFTSAYFTLVIPLIVFCSDVTRITRIHSLSKLDPIVHYHTLRDRCLATITLCLASMVSFLVLSVWMSIYLSFNWDRKLDRMIQLSQQQQQQQRQQQHELGETASDQDTPDDAAGGTPPASPPRSRPSRRQQSPPPSSPAGQLNADITDEESSESSEEDNEIMDEREQVLRDYFSL